VSSANPGFAARFLLQVSVQVLTWYWSCSSSAPSPLIMRSYSCAFRCSAMLLSARRSGPSPVVLSCSCLSRASLASTPGFLMLETSIPGSPAHIDHQHHDHRGRRRTQSCNRHHQLARAAEVDYIRSMTRLWMICSLQHQWPNASMRSMHKKGQHQIVLHQLLHWMVGVAVELLLRRQMQQHHHNCEQYVAVPGCH